MSSLLLFHVNFFVVEEGLNIIYGRPSQKTSSLQIRNQLQGAGWSSNVTRVRG